MAWYLACACEGTDHADQVTSSSLIDSAAVSSTFEQWGKNTLDGLIDHCDSMI